MPQGAAGYRNEHIAYHLTSKRYDLFHTQVFMGDMLEYCLYTAK